jgi:hypothetical protein
MVRLERRDTKDEASLLPMEKQIAQGISIRENRLSREKNLGSLPQRQKRSVGCLSLPSTLMLEMPCKLYLFLDCDLYIKLSSSVPLTFYE